MSGALSTMAMARVWNDGDTDWTEEFRGEKITIPSKKYIEMNLFDATQFKGQYSPIIRDGLGNDLRPKRIRVERLGSGGEVLPKKVSEHVCMACAKEFNSSGELQTHIYSTHSDQLTDTDEKKKAAEVREKKTPRAPGPQLS